MLPFCDTLALRGPHPLAPFPKFGGREGRVSGFGFASICLRLGEEFTDSVEHFW